MAKKIGKQLVRDIKLDYHFAVKENLAKILAEENIDVRIDNHETASFNVKDRILTIPMWRGISNYLYDMLIVHEVGHARYTPHEKWVKGIRELGQTIVDSYNKLYPNDKDAISIKAAETVAAGYINVVEDARIDRMQREKFPGSIKDYALGSKELLDRKFFGEELQWKTLADRINVFTKCSIHAPNVKFSEIEHTILNEVFDNQTFEDVLVSAKKLVEHEIDEVSESAQKAQKAVDFSNFLEKLRVQTDQAVANNLKDLVKSSNNSVGNFKVETSTSLSGIVVSAENYLTMLGPSNVQDSYNLTETHSNFKNYISASVSRFEMYKAAADYTGKTEKNTGIVNTNSIHSYRYNEEIFQKAVIERASKNHCIVFIVDLSSSMASYFFEVMEQLYAMIRFCRNVRIPYEAYMFSNGIKNPGYMRQIKSAFKVTSVTRDNLKEVNCGDTLSLVNVFSHKNRLTKELHTFSRIMYKAKGGRTLYGMRGTPLDSTILITNVLVNDLIKKTNTEIPTVVFITDGESNNHIPYNGTDMMIKDEFDGKLYAVPRMTPQTVVFLEMLKNRTGANLINYFLCDPENSFSTITKYTKNYSRDFINRKYVSCDGKGFDKVHIFDTSNNEKMNRKTSIQMADTFARHIANTIRKT